jgi:hypothetical protein
MPMLANATEGSSAQGPAGRLLDEAADAVVVGGGDDPERACGIDRHAQRGNAQVRPARQVLREHRRVVHLVDVIPGEHQHVLRRMRVDDVEILQHGVGRAHVPRAIHALLRRQHFEELAEIRVEETPAALQVLDQAVRLVLRRNADAPDPGIDAVAQGEVDDAVLATEGNRRLRAPLRQLPEPRAATARQHHRVGARQRGCDLRLVAVPLPWLPTRNRTVSAVESIIVPPWSRCRGCPGPSHACNAAAAGRHPDAADVICRSAVRRVVGLPRG